MKTVFGAGVVCIAMMLSTVARAADTHQFCYDSKNKSYNLDFRCSSDDLKGCITDQIKDGDNGGDKGGNGCTITLPPDNTPDNTPVCDNNKGDCDNHNPDCHNDKKDCDKHDCDDHHGDCHKKPCDPVDPNTPAVPLPASSALGGVGLAAVVLMGYARSRKLNVA
jgi:hypothetical protein